MRRGEHWLATVANRRVHGTTRAVPAVRFETEERAALQPLPSRPYHSPLLPPMPPIRPARPRDTVLPAVVVERRSLETYAALAGAES